MAAEEAEAQQPWFKRGRGRWGEYLPHQRGNVDQVPLPFVVDMGITYEEKGAKRVAINQLGPALSKRQCTGQVAFRPEPPPPPPADALPAVKHAYTEHLMVQPPPCLVFRGTGKQIKQEEKDAYPPELVVLWQPKAWVDRPIAVQWVELAWKQLVAADRAAGVCDDEDRYLLFDDNLDAQKQPEYLEALKALQTDNHKIAPDKTDQLQPVDDGLGRQLAQYTGQEQDRWLDDDENLSRWEDGKLTASDRRILIAQWYCAAWRRICTEKADTLRKYFEHTGALLTADGTADELIKMEGVPKGKTFSWEDDSLDSIMLRGGAGGAGGVDGEAGGMAATATEPEPDDVCPTREAAEADAVLGDEELDDVDDEDDETDVPRAPRTAPDGWRIVEEPPPAAALEPKHPEQQQLVGRSLLFNWRAIGWCVGVVESANGDRRFKVAGDVVNFYVFYELDGDTSAHVLKIDNYGTDHDDSWVLLEEVVG